MDFEISAFFPSNEEPQEHLFPKIVITCSPQNVEECSPILDVASGFENEESYQSYKMALGDRVRKLDIFKKVPN